MALLFCMGWGKWELVLFLVNPSHAGTGGKTHAALRM